MDAVTATAQMTAEEFLARPEDPNGRRWQLIDGELVMNEPTPMHSDAQGCVYAALRAWSRETAGRGWVGLPMTVRLDERNVCEPDVVWYREARRPQREGPGPHALPDLVVGVRSPSTWRHDIGAKKTNYERHGAGELWLVDTASDVVFVLRRSQPKSSRFDVSLDFSPGETLTSPLLPGFELPVARIFELG
jgi:Uma2 family endonuclease